MGNFNYQEQNNKGLSGDDKELLYEYVICGEHELLYLDTLLSEVFAQRVN